MDWLIDFIAKFWLQILLGLIAGFFVGQWKSAKSKNVKLENDLIIVKDISHILLEHEIRKSFHFHMRNKCITDDDLDSFNDMCNAAERAGSNGTIAAMKKKIDVLKIVDAVAEKPEGK